MPAPQQSSEEVHSLIRTAMVRQQPIEVVYEGRHRLLCPHVLGRNKEGRLRVLCYQYGGESESGLRRKDERGDWRCFSLEKVSQVRILEAPWQTAEGLQGRPKCIDQIEREVNHQPERDPQKGQ